MPITEKQKIQTFAGTADQPALNDDQYCTVLYGFGRVEPTRKSYVDGYECIGGVIRNVPRTVAENWSKGIRSDGKPTPGRVYIQAILPKTATEADFIAATGMNRVSMAQVAASISHVDARALIEALGQEEAAALAMQISKEISTARK